MVLRIGCVPDLPLQRLQGLLGALDARDGDSRPAVKYLRSPEQLRRLVSGELDVAVIHLMRTTPGVTMELLFAAERLCAFLPIGHRLASSPSLAPGDFAADTLLIAPRAIDPPLHDRLMGALDAAGGQFRAMREVGGGHPRDVLLAVAEGRGITIGPASTLDVVGDADAIVSRHEIEPELSGPDTVIAWRSDTTPHVQDLHAVARALRGT
jgi:hypothetical protein